MHIISAFLSLDSAHVMPIPIQAGSDGGTVVVIKSRARQKILIKEIPFSSSKGRLIRNPNKERIAMKIIYFSESFLNLNWTSYR
jgi:hypothetical protein